MSERKTLRDSLDRKLGPHPDFDGRMMTAPMRRVITLYIVGICIGLVGGFACAALWWGLRLV